MLPTPSEQDLRQCLASAYELQDADLFFLPVSHAGETWVYRAETPQGTFFLKLKRYLPETGVAVSLFLREQGIPAVTPLRAKNGFRWAPLGNCFLMVFPCIDGHPIEVETFSDSAWEHLGSILGRLHSIRPPAELIAIMEKESFAPYGSGLLHRVNRRLTDSTFAPASIADKLRGAWEVTGPLMSDFFARVSHLGRVAGASPSLRSVCHGDLSPANILQSADGRLHLIDWDGPEWSPPEKDLRLIAGRDRASFKSGYGMDERNKPVAEYLSWNWLLQEAFDCMNRILFSESDDVEKQWAFEMLSDLMSRMRSLISQAR